VTLFVKGNKSGGRKPGSRNRLSKAFVDALASDFEQYGAGVIKVLRAENPSAYCHLVASLVPKELDLEVTNKATELREWMAWITTDIARAMIRTDAPAAPELPAVLPPSRPLPAPRLHHVVLDASAQEADKK
jgi:hypothetical protein